MQSVTPVFGAEEVRFEKVIALDQPEYAPIVILPLIAVIDGKAEPLALACRFRLSPEERKAVADGADLVITELTFGGLFTPLSFQFCQPHESPGVK